ncbi:MAG: 3-hydroxyacyl-ACP dehydratase FabZ [Actinomycetota bacterium]|nr:3-hydroxyacyl-ACP dehydratase FabZ [Actinomycetota bacterium]
MNFPKPEEVIPHRKPFLFLTEVTQLTISQSAHGYWQLGSSEDFFEGHFPDFPTLPGVLMCESIAQLGAYTLLSDPNFENLLPLFGGIDNVRFRRKVSPGERLDLSVEISKISTRGGKGHGKAHVEGDLACSCDLLFVFASI